MPAYKTFTDRTDLDKWMAIEPRCSFEFRASPRGKIGAPPLLSWQGLTSANDIPGGDARHEVKRLDDDKRVYCQFSTEPTVMTITREGTTSVGLGGTGTPMDVDPVEPLDTLNYARELVSLSQVTRQNAENLKLLSDSMSQAMDLSAAASESLAATGEDSAKLELYRQGGLVLSTILGILRQYQDKKLPQEEQAQLKEWRRMHDSVAAMGGDLDDISVMDILALQEIKKDEELNQVIGLYKKKIMSRNSKAFTASEEE